MMIKVHDYGELLVGDKIKKNKDEIVNENFAINKIASVAKERFPEINFKSVMHEYEERKTPESIFVKGLDVLEAYLTMISAKKTDLNNSTAESKISSAENVKEISPALYTTTLLAIKLLSKLHKDGEQFELDV